MKCWEVFVVVLLVFLCGEPSLGATARSRDIHQQIATGQQPAVVTPPVQQQQQQQEQQQQQQQAVTTTTTRGQQLAQMLVSTDVGGVVFLAVVVLGVVGAAVVMLVKFKPNYVPTDGELESVGRSKRFLSRFASLIGVTFASVWFQYFDEQSAVDGGTGLMVMASFLLILVIERFRYFNSGGVDRSQAAEDTAWYLRARPILDYVRWGLAAVMLLTVAVTVFMDPSSIDPAVTRILVMIIMSLMVLLSIVIAVQVALEGTQTTGISTSDSRSYLAILTPVLVLLFMVLSIVLSDLEFVFRVFTFATFFLGNNLIDEVLSREAYSKIVQFAINKRKGTVGDVDVTALFKTVGLGAKPFVCTDGTSIEVSDGAICVPEGGALLPLSVFTADSKEKALEHAVRMVDLEEKLKSTPKERTLKTYNAPFLKLKATVEDVPVPSETSANRYVFELELPGEPKKTVFAVLHSTLPPALYDVEQAPSRTTQAKEQTTGVGSLKTSPFMPTRTWLVPGSQLEMEDVKDEIAHFRLPQVPGLTVVLTDTTRGVVDVLETQSVNPWNLISQNGPIIGDLGKAAIGQSGAIVNLQATTLSAFLVKGSPEQLAALTVLAEEQRSLAVLVKAKFHQADAGVGLDDPARLTPTLIDPGQVGVYQSDTEVVAFVLYDPIPTDVVGLSPTDLPAAVVIGDGVTANHLKGIRPYGVSAKVVRLFSQP